MNSTKVQQIFDKIQSGKLTVEQFQNMLEVSEESLNASKRLTVQYYEQRYENSNEIAKSYMEEFAARGLVYIPKLSSDAASENLLRIATEIIKSHTSQKVSSERLTVKFDDMKYIKSPQ